MSSNISATCSSEAPVLMTTWTQYPRAFSSGVSFLSGSVTARSMSGAMPMSEFMKTDPAPMAPRVGTRGGLTSQRGAAVALWRVDVGPGNNSMCHQPSQSACQKQTSLHPIAVSNMLSVHSDPAR
eukprot:3523408-Rhodomonas_salina.1